MGTRTSANTRLDSKYTVTFSAIVNCVTSFISSIVQQFPIKNSSECRPTKSITLSTKRPYLFLIRTLRVIANIKTIAGESRDMTRYRKVPLVHSTIRNEIIVIIRQTCITVLAHSLSFEFILNHTYMPSKKIGKRFINV